jgi:hypothetical protein
MIRPIVHVMTVADGTKRCYYASCPGVATLFSSSDGPELLRSVIRSLGAEDGIKTVTLPGHATRHEVVLIHEVLQADAKARN